MAVQAKAINITGLLSRIENDIDRLQMLFDIALEEFPKWITNIENKLSAKDAVALVKLSHTYKGSSATLGADNLAAIYLKLETAAKENNLSLFQETFPNILEETNSVIEEIELYRKGELLY